MTALEDRGGGEAMTMVQTLDDGSMTCLSSWREKNKRREENQILKLTMPS